MEPRIQYAQTADGVSIAFATYGEGDPIVWANNPIASHVQLEWQQPIFRAAFSRLVADRRMLVRFDTRGVGLSDRDVDDLSLDARLLDLEAVTDHLALKMFALVGFEDGGLTAIGYALRHPERVTHLLLVNGLAHGADWRATPRGQAFRGMVDDFEMWSENVGAVVFGFGREEARRHAEFVRACVDHEMLPRLNDATWAIDLTGLLSQITTPTLVIRHSGYHMPMNITRELASRIPNARLLVIEGSYADNAEQLFGGVTDFLGEGEEPESTTELPEGMAVILFADIVESTALTEQLGDAAFRAKARELDTSLRKVIRESGGTPVEGKLVGDGVLAVFTSARQAIECALRCNAAGESVDLQLHLGVHAGDVIREANNVYGGAVNIAARIAGASAPGEVLVSDTVRGLARTSAGVAFDDRGERSLKGVADPQRLFAVRGGGG